MISNARNIFNLQNFYDFAILRMEKMIKDDTVKERKRKGNSLFFSE